MCVQVFRDFYAVPVSFLSVVNRKTHRSIGLASREFAVVSGRFYQSDGCVWVSLTGIYTVATPVGVCNRCLLALWVKPPSDNSLCG